LIYRTLSACLPGGPAQHTAVISGSCSAFMDFFEVRKNPIRQAHSHTSASADSSFYGSAANDARARVSAPRGYAPNVAAAPEPGPASRPPVRPSGPGRLLGQAAPSAVGPLFRHAAPGPDVPARPSKAQGDGRSGPSKATGVAGRPTGIVASRRARSDTELSASSAWRLSERSAHQAARPVTG
jgi:hypothetical protein